MTATLGSDRSLDVPQMPRGTLHLEPPPELEPHEGASGALMMALPMLGSVGAIVMVTMSNSGPTGFITGGMFLLSSLGFVAVNARASEVAEGNPAPRFYWDWRRRRSEHGYRKFCGTAPLHLLMGLRAALGLLDAEGLDNVIARHARLSRAVHAAVGCWAQEGGALQFYCRMPQARSVSVTAVQTVAGIDPEAIRRVARERFQVAVAGGLGSLTGRVFRIGHLGDMNEPMILGCLAGVEAALDVLQVPHGRGALEQAVASLAEDVAA